MNLSPVKVVRENTGGLRKRPATRPGTISGTGINRSSGRAANDPRATLRGGRRLSEPVGAGGELALRVLLRELVEAQIRRVCRKKYNFDWSAFVEGGGDRLMTGILRFRAVREGRRRGLDLRLTDIAIGTVVEVVGEVIAEWTDQPGLRPTYAKFCQEQGRRGEQGRVTQAEKASCNARRVLALVADGETSDTVIAGRLDLDRSTVWRIRRKAVAEAVSVAPQEKADASEPPAFPDPEIPSAERWPVRQFMRRTGAALGAGDARHLADVARCYEAEGRTDELVHAIRRSADAEVRDPWAYLQRCISNRADAWTVTPQLLADVLTWAGEKKLEYALMAIGSGQVSRPLAYLRRVLATAVGEGRGRTWVVDRPVAMAVAMSARLAPALQVAGAEEAVAAEVEDVRTRHMESYRRRHGRLPWEDPEGASTCCIGLKEPRDEEFNLVSKNLDSSRESSKADATPEFDRRDVSPARGRETLERPENGAEGGESGGGRCAGSRGEAGKQGQGGVSTAPQRNPSGFLEQAPCRHSVAALLTAVMVLDDVGLVDCAAGCGHQVYSDRGPVECPCHWEPVKVAQVIRALRLYQNPDALRL